jgi:hypothetical protein
VRDNNSSTRQHVFDHPQAERKAEMEPNSVGDDLGGKAMAAVERVTVCHGPSSHWPVDLINEI